MSWDEDTYQKKDIKIATATTLIALGSLAVAAVTVLANMRTSAEQLRSQQQQFVSNSHSTQYIALLDALSSDTQAVRVAAVRGLVAFVLKESNYDQFSSSTQRDQQTDVAQVLQTLIKEEAPGRRNGSLNKASSGVPDVVPRTITQLAHITSVAPVSVDFNTLDLHGLSMSGLTTHGSLYAPGLDLRRATLEGGKFLGRTTLTNAFFTCANLTHVDFGTADLAGTDFSGANLTGADLSRVKHLQADQLRHALLSDTRLPFQAPVTRQWTREECDRVVAEMTGMLPGQGYAPSAPTCPRDPMEIQLMDPPPAHPVQLLDVCNQRASE